MDPEFEARLFSTALTRLEEAPLRLVENDTHGSPFHELINSAAFLKALDMVPELGEKLTSMKSRHKATKKRKQDVKEATINTAG